VSERIEKVVLRPGTKGNMSDGLTGLVTGGALYGTAADVQYRVAWWNGRERKEEWLRSSEIQACETKREMRIGFRGNGE